MFVLDILVSGGWLMLPLVVCSVLSLAISLERGLSLRKNTVMPKDLLSSVLLWMESDQLSAERIKEVKESSPLGAIIVSGLLKASLSRQRMQESIQECATGVVHDLERNLSALGTIAAVAPLLGLLGTVVGMIKVFTAIMLDGSGNTTVLAGGISEALITTAVGMGIAIPTLICHRFFHRKVDTLVVAMEQEATHLVDRFYGQQAGS